MDDNSKGVVGTVCFGSGVKGGARHDRLRPRSGYYRYRRCLTDGNHHFWVCAMRLREPSVHYSKGSCKGCCDSSMRFVQRDGDRRGQFERVEESLKVTVLEVADVYRC